MLDGLALVMGDGFCGVRLFPSFAMVRLAGAADEAHQPFVPRQHANWCDLGADALAAMTGVTNSRAIWPKDDLNGH